MKINKLIHHLLLTPIVLLSLAFLSLFFAFNFIIQIYIESVTANSIKNELYYMKMIYYDEDALDENDVFEDENFIIWVRHLILGESGDIISDEEYMIGDRKDPSRQIASYLTANHLLKDGDVETISYNGRNYYMKITKFDIQNSTYLTGKAKSQDTYYAVIFADVSPVHELHRMLNMILGILILTIAIPSIFISYFNSKKIELSFSNLQNCIIKLGKREQIDDKEDLGFDEFNEMKNTTLEIETKLREAESSREIFFQNASHELRTPLMSIQGYAESIAKNVAKDNKVAANIILSESRKMKSLVDDILTLSRMETGAKQLEIEEIDVKELLNTGIYSIQKIAKDLGIHVLCDFEKEGFVFAGDEEKLSHAITNILSNAIRYAKSEILIDYEIKEQEVCLHFTNDGEPIATEDLPHIFDRFYKGKGGKFGIGLALCKEIMKLHHGSITVTSDEKATCFTLQLPLDRL